MNLYYDRESLTWDKFEDMAIVFHQNSYLESCWNRKTRKNFEKMSLCLWEMLKIINRDKSKVSWLYFDENSKCISLLKMDSHDHISHYNEIAELSLKMRNCMEDKTFINDYIFSLKEKIVAEVMFLKCNQELDESIKKDIFEQFAVLNEIGDNYPEDIFRQVKEIKALLKQNNKIKQQKELENRKRQEEIRTNNRPEVDRINALFYGAEEEKEKVLQRVEATLERMCALQEITKDKMCKMVLTQDILQF